MKIEFIHYRKLDELNRTVKPGDTMQSGPDVDDKLMAAYVRNGIAKDITPAQPGGAATASSPAPPVAPPAAEPAEPAATTASAAENQEKEATNAG